MSSVTHLLKTFLVPPGWIEIISKFEIWTTRTYANYPFLISLLISNLVEIPAQKTKFFMTDFLSKCDQISWKQWTVQTVIYSKSAIDALEKGVWQQRHQNHVTWRCFDVFIVNFEHISHFFLLPLLLTLNK